jgi:hypothetical protein
MKLKKGFVVREVGGRTVAVAIGEMAKSFHGMISLNGSGKFIWQALADETTEEAIVNDLLEEYDVSREIAEIDVKKFIDQLRAEGLILE